MILYTYIGELEELFRRAVTCIILGKASTQRTRVLSSLCSQESRVKNLEYTAPYGSHATILQKMNNIQILNGKEVREVGVHSLFSLIR